MIDINEKEKRMELVRRIAIGLAEENNDPILADTKILSNITFHGKPSTEKELDACNPVAIRGDGARIFTHVRMDGRGQILIKWPNGEEQTMKFWIPNSYLNDNTKNDIPVHSCRNPIANIRSEKELQKTIGRIRTADNNFPLKINEIPTFPFAKFEDMLIALRNGSFAIRRFSFHQDAAVLGLVAPGAKLAYLLSMLTSYLVPLLCAFLAFTVSTWFLVGILYFFIGVRFTTSIWHKAILAAAVESELAFCLLFYTSKINAYDLSNSKEYEWQKLKMQS